MLSTRPLLSDTRCLLIGLFGLYHEYVIEKFIWHSSNSFQLHNTFLKVQGIKKSQTFENPGILITVNVLKLRTLKKFYFFRCS